MKQPNEKKQDLLLDALSCIDEDILEKSLALRDGMTPAAAETPSEKVPLKGVAANPYLLDLTPPQKPPKKNLWRMISVVAAACLLMCVIPLSMWMVGSVSKNEAAGETVDTPLDGTEDIAPEGSMDAPIDSIPSEETAGEPEIEEPGNTPVETGEPMEESTEEPPEDVIESVTEAGTHFEPHEMVWNLTTDDSMAGYTAQAHNGANVELIATFSGAESAPVPTEDEMALQMVAQWLLSVYALDYGDHFPLFYESFVHEAFIKEAVRYDRTYRDAIQKIDSVVDRLFPVENVNLILQLEENTLLAGDELEDFRTTKPAFQTDRGFYPELITAVRRVRVSGSLDIDGFYPFDWVREILSEAFYIYEYEGKWYLDETFMDDDLSIDLLGSGKADSGFYKMKTTTGTVVAVDDIYLYLDTGDAFRIDSAKVHNQTDGGEWHDFVIYVGDTVSVSHYSLEMEGLTRSLDGVEIEEWTLSTATEVNYYG